MTHITQKMANEFIIHPISPYYNSDSRVLILGSFPSVKSREEGFFYGNKQNRFWRVIATLCLSDTPDTVEGKKELLCKNRIALWDVIHSCRINGSSDSSITDVAVNDIGSILSASDIKAIFVNGKNAFELYNKYIYPKIGREAVCLPSTSPANAGCGFDKLCAEWKIILSHM